MDSPGISGHRSRLPATKVSRKRLQTVVSISRTQLTEYTCLGERGGESRHEARGWRKGGGMGSTFFVSCRHSRWPIAIHLNKVTQGHCEGFGALLPHPLASPKKKTYDCAEVLWGSPAAAHQPKKNLTIRWGVNFPFYPMRENSRCSEFHGESKYVCKT